MKKQTAGRKYLGELAPKFAALNDDVLFGQVWADEDELPARDRSMITIAALISGGNFAQLKAHLTMGNQNGLTEAEVVAMIIHLSFYVGWPKAWSAFSVLKEVYPTENK